MRGPLSSRLALMLGTGAVLCGTATTAALAQATSTPQVYVDTRALDQLGYPAKKRPSNDGDGLKLKAPPEHRGASAPAPPPRQAASREPPPAATPAAPPAAPPAAASRAAAPPPPPPAAAAGPAPAAPPAPAAAAPPAAPPANGAAAPPRPAPAAAPPPAAAARPPAAPPPAAPAPPPVAQRRGESRVAFPAGGTELPQTARADLDQMARRLAGDESLHVQLNAYASDGGDQASQARRVSLSRALAVRAYLIDKGVRSTRLDVRALGKPQDDGPADRVDLVVMGR